MEWREAVLQKRAGPPLMEDFTLPHILHVDSTWTQGGFPEFMSSMDHFSLNGSPANPLSRIHVESSWSPVTPSGQHGLHLRTQGNMNSPSKTPYGV